MESEDLVATQPVDTSICDSSFFSTQQSTAPQFWGKLYPVTRSLRPIDLAENDVTIGMGGTCPFSNDVKGSLSENVSFQITRKSEKTKGNWLKTVCRLHDNSTPKGLLLNGRPIQGSILAKPLKTNDIISFPQRTTGHREAYVFIDSCNPICDINVPAIVSRAYQISYRLGAGAFGEVFLAFDKDSCHPLAMKTILKSGLTNDDAKRHSKLINELNVLRSVNNPHLIQLVDVKEYKNDHFIFLEFMEGHDLSKRLNEKQALEEKTAKLYFFQICKAVQYLHSKGIIHRDIKPANVLLASSETDTIIKLTDFGLTKILTPSTVMKTMCGTKMYAAPEILSGAGPYTGQVDVWSMGVLLYTCLCGSEPFSVASHLIEKHIMRSLYVMPPDTWRKISVFAKNLVDMMLLLEPTERIKVNEIMNYVWIKDTQMHARLNKIYYRFGL
ncbi:myosin light chain kinase A-like [Thrips palmi]|uniref:Myosin light chain kinase A-like n=1 Tax=Thrips palmi TaxID=161013 RepID=A0A6P8Z2F0_THRPL|nr:myosin light chain kinase A-like [Thrips palmi]